MPAELKISRTTAKKRKAATINIKKAKQKKDIDPNHILSRLENMEKTESDAEDDETGLYITSTILYYHLKFCYLFSFAVQRTRQMTRTIMKKIRRKLKMKKWKMKNWMKEQIMLINILIMVNHILMKMIILMMKLSIRARHNPTTVKMFE